MRTVAKIPEKETAAPLLRVAAYCRVSTHDSEQLASLENQISYYEARINVNPEWVFAGVYSDIGSGTRIKYRLAFNKLLAACRQHKVDMILTKSAHRFARNTVDALKTIRMLRKRGVDIYFEQEDIHTISETSEFLLTVICARAQEESYSKSEDIKWGIQKAFGDPESKYYQRTCYGYKHDADGKLIIDDGPASVVRIIFALAAGGKSLAQISDTLAEMGIPSPRGNAVWSRETLRKILHNEKYTGTVILQKTYVPNYLNHKQVRNLGELDKFEAMGNHEAIIAGTGWEKRK